MNARERNAQLITVARPHLAWAAELFATGHVIYLVDTDGVVLEVLGGPAALPGPDAPGCDGPIHGPDGAIVGAIDVTAPVEDGHRERALAVRHIVYAIEQELALLHAGEMERDLRRRAEDATRARDEVMTMVSHHLRTPLALVATSAALLERLLSPPPGSELARQLGQIELAAARMRSQVTNLLDAGRLDAGRIRPRLAVHALGDLMKETADDLTPLARRRGQHFEIELEAEAELRVSCDRELTLQVLWNLVENALKFAPDASTIVLRGRREGEAAHVCVIDRGPGIEPEGLARIFDRYFQLRPPSRDGVGLGLYIARAFAEAQGAAISVASTPDHGSEFCITLPLAEPPRLPVP